MIQTDGAWLRNLADAVDEGLVEVARVELNHGVMLGVLKPGTFEEKRKRDENSPPRRPR